MSARNFANEVAQGTLEGLYVSATATSIADPVAFLDPLFGAGVKATPATRAPGVRKALAEAEASADPAVREAAFQQANDAIRESAPLIPLVSPGSVAFRADVGGDHVAAGHRSPRFVHARRPAAARVHAGRRAGRCLLR
jgi:ABC-type transport system substrate-binding protein